MGSKSRGLSCSTLNIRQDFLKSGNLLHKLGFVDSQFGITVCLVMETLSRVPLSIYGSLRRGFLKKVLTYWYFGYLQSN